MAISLAARGRKRFGWTAYLAASDKSYTKSGMRLIDVEGQMTESGEAVRPLSSGMAERICAREAVVLGKPPRIAPREREAVAQQVTATSMRLRAGILGDVPPLPLDEIPEIMFTLCCNSDLWERVMALSVQMQSSTGRLPPRDRQLAILRTAWLCQAPYEWGEHVKHSKHAGISSEEIERLTIGSAAAGWNDHDRSILSAAEELHRDAMVEDETWDVLARAFDDAQLFELLVLIGQFTNIAYFQNSLRLRLGVANEGLGAR